jgi:hypothetical protein
MDWVKIAVWDLENSENSPSQLASWKRRGQSSRLCPDSADRLAVLTENSTQMSVYLIEERHDSLYRETVQYDISDSLTKIPVLINSFCWHSKDYNRIMVSHTLKRADLVVADYCPIGFSVNDNPNVAMNEKVLRLDTMCTSDHELDIGKKMKIERPRTTEC